MIEWRKERMKRSAGISLLLCVCTVLLCAVPLPAAAVNKGAPDEVQIVRALGIMEGDETGNLNLSSYVTRAEFTKMMVAASSYRDTIGSGSNLSLFKDVKSGYWATEYIKTAVEAGWFVGYVDGTYRPNNNITLEEGCTALLRLLGYDSTSLAGSYPAAQLTKAQELGLREGIAAVQGQKLTRSDCVTLFYQLLTTKNSSGAYYLNVLEPTLKLVKDDGTIDTVALVNGKMKGPVRADANWQSTLALPAENMSYYRNGSAVASSAIQTNDVLYYSKAMRTVWAWSNKVTGTITAVSPSASAPTSVTVAGNTYTIETTEAAYALSSLGAYQAGDVVTLLLGRDGEAAFAVSSSEASATQIGIVVSTAAQSFTDAGGHSYTGKAVKLLGLDGATYIYPNTKSVTYDEGTVLQASVDADGNTVLTKIYGNSVSGKINAAGTALNGISFADNVNILDVYDQQGKSVTPSRLAGCTLQSSDVFYCAENTLGEIQTLILKDYTGDLHDYGVITDEQKKGAESDTQYTYTYDIRGTAKTYSTTADWDLQPGAIQIDKKDGEITRFVNLTGAQLTQVSNGIGTTGGNQYLLADTVTVYIWKNYVYYQTSLEHVTDGSYTLMGYYDQSGASGGRIRVIVATERTTS